MALLAALGFSSGLPLYLTSLLLGARLADDGIDVAAIATFSLVGLSYTFKWLWAPLIDRHVWPWLGRRRGWILVTQLALVLAIVALALLDPRHELGAFAAVAALVAFLSASQDIVIDGYRTDVLAGEERAAGAAVYVLGYRAALLVAGTGALALADIVSWRVLTLGVAALLLACVVVTLIADEPPAVTPPRTLVEAVVWPWKGLLTVPRAAVVLLFVALYKFGDHLVLTLVIPFLKTQFDNATVAAVYKGVGFAGVLAGGLFAGALVARWGTRRMLVLFGALQALANLGYAALAAAGKNLPMFAGVVLLDELANSMGTAAFLAYLMSLCDRRVSATQIALLTSLSSVGQRVFGWSAGPIVTSVGWEGFFIVTALVALPGLLLVRWLPERS